MTMQRASYTIRPEILRRFNEVVPARERSRVVQSLMEGILDRRTEDLAAIAHDVETHPDFAQVRETASAFDTLIGDGLDSARKR